MIDLETPAPSPAAAMVDRFGAASIAFIGLAVLVTCAIVGMAISTKVAVILLAAAVLPLAVVDPWLTLALFVAVEVSQSASVAKAHGYPSPILLLQLAALACVVGMAVERKLRWAWSPIMTTALLYLGSQALSVAGADQPRLALSTVVQSARDLTTLFFVVLLILACRRYWAVAKVCVAVLAALAALTVVQQFALHNATTFFGLSDVSSVIDVGATTVRHSGPIGDPNFWGRVLVMFMPFAAAAFLLRPDRRHRVLWGGALISLVAGVYLSQSRGGLLALGASLTVFVALAGWRYGRWLVLTPLFLLVVLILPFTGPRLRTLLQLQGSTQGIGDQSLVVRSATLKIGEQMLKDHPLLGIGAGNYLASSEAYGQKLNLPGVGAGLQGGIAPHNAYLEKAAEGGLVGLAAWLLFLGSILFCAVRAWLVSQRRAPPGVATPDVLLCAAAVAGIVGWMVASVVLHVEQFRTLLVLAGIIAALDIRARDLPTPPGPRLATRWRWREPLHVVAAIALVAGGVQAGRSVLSRDTWSADITTVASIGHNLPGTYVRGAQFNVLALNVVLPSLARVMASPALTTDAERRGAGRFGIAGVKITATPSPLSGLILVTVTGPNRSEVVAIDREAAILGTQRVNALQAGFLVSALDYVPTVHRHEVLRLSGKVVIAFFVLTGFFYVAWILRSRHRNLLYPPERVLALPTARSPGTRVPASRPPSARASGARGSGARPTVTTLR